MMNRCRLAGRNEIGLCPTSQSHLRLSRLFCFRIFYAQIGIGYRVCVFQNLLDLLALEFKLEHIYLVVGQLFSATDDVPVGLKKYGSAIM